MDATAPLTHDSTMSGKTYSITDACRQLDTTTRTLRFYEEKKLFIANRPKGVHRRYSGDDIEQLRTILQLVRFGFSVREVGHVIRLPEDQVLTAFEERHTELLAEAEHAKKLADEIAIKLTRMRSSLPA